MLMLAGLLGMMVVGATAFVNMDDEESDAVTEESDAPGGANAAAVQDVSDLLTEVEETDSADDRAASDLQLEATDEHPIEDATATDDVTATEDVTTQGDDWLRGGAEADQLEGASGDDEIHGEDGNDILSGDEGDDELHGEDGEDALFGGAGNDLLYGHNENDNLYGEDGDDTLDGGSGNDTLTGGDGNDALHGGLDSDYIDGGLGADTLFGGAGNDVISGLCDDADADPDDISDVDCGDYLNGGDGDDLIVAGCYDIVTGGDGADVICAGDWIPDGARAEVMDFAAGSDTLVLVYDDSTDPDADPDIDLRADPDAAGGVIVTMNGADVVLVRNGEDFSLADITLMSQSVAQAGLLAG